MFSSLIYVCEARREKHFPRKNKTEHSKYQCIYIFTLKYFRIEAEYLKNKNVRETYTYMKVKDCQDDHKMLQCTSPWGVRKVLILSQ